MITLVRKAIYDFFEKGAERRRAQRLAAERLAEQKAAEQRKAEAAQREAEEKARITLLSQARAEAERAEERRRAAEAARYERLASENAAREAARQQALEEEAAELRRQLNPFQVGEKYENRKGTFTVIELSGDNIRIIWESGEEITDTIAAQARILRNMKREQTLHDAWYSPRSGDCVRCERCGAWIYFDNAFSFGGRLYGSTCIRHVRGY